MAYNARHPRWTWWFGIAVTSNIRYYTFSGDVDLPRELAAIESGQHLLVIGYVAFPMPNGLAYWRYGILELSRDQIVFHRVVPFFPLPRRMAGWDAGIWTTKRRTSRRGDSLFMRFGWPRMTVVECEAEGQELSLAVFAIDLSLVEAVLTGMRR